MYSRKPYKMLRCLLALLFDYVSYDFYFFFMFIWLNILYKKSSTSRRLGILELFAGQWDAFKYTLVYGQRLCVCVHFMQYVNMFSSINTSVHKKMTLTVILTVILQ